MHFFFLLFFIIFNYFPEICCGQGAVICSTLLSGSRRNRCIEFKENIADGELWMSEKKIKSEWASYKSTKHKAIQNWGYWYDCLALKSRSSDWHLALILSIVTTCTLYILPYYFVGSVVKHRTESPEVYVFKFDFRQTTYGDLIRFLKAGYINNKILFCC